MKIINITDIPFSPLKILVTVLFFMINYSNYALKTHLKNRHLSLLEKKCENENDILDETYQNKVTKEKMNVVFILSDDHRYDFMGFMDKIPFLKTPNMDRMATEGVHMRNAFVSTSLCSPSRTSILTGQYAHNHKVIRNSSPLPKGTVFFPVYLQNNGYQTAFIGKWHIGDHKDDDPRPGFDFWVSFKGQGVYHNPTINLNGKKITHDSSYVTDVLTNYAIDFLKHRDKKNPFFLYLSHKAVHGEFAFDGRKPGEFANEKIPYPKTMFPPNHKYATVTEDEYNFKHLPQWVKNARRSRLGVDNMWLGKSEYEEFYKLYCEEIISLDVSIGTVLDYLEQEKLMDNTIIIYMGDNGFTLGEHGLIDKRQAYEESIRVPLIAIGGGIPFKTVVDEFIMNIDIGPTILDICGIAKPEYMDGASFKNLLYQKSTNWKDTIFYEHFWERVYPVPTVHAVRTSNYKYIRYYGLYDLNELYDIENDPLEMNNLISDPRYAQVAIELNKAISNWLSTTGGVCLHLKGDYYLPHLDY